MKNFPNTYPSIHFNDPIYIISSGLAPGKRKSGAHTPLLLFPIKSLVLVGDLRQRLIQLHRGLVQVALADNQRRDDAQGTGAQVVQQYAVLHRALDNLTCQVAFDVDGTHQADAAWAIEEVVFRA